jgi:hypothetical protein
MRMFRRRARNEYEDDATQTTATTTTSERRAYVQNGAEPAPVDDGRRWHHGPTRAVMTLLGVGVAGLLAWTTTTIGEGTTGGYWAVYGILAGAGLVLALSQLLGGWTKWGRPAFSQTVFLFAFVPTAIAVAWILVFHQPHSTLWRGHVTNWSGDLGIAGFVNDMGGDLLTMLSFGLGLVFGFCFDTRPALRRTTPPATTARRIPADDADADEPITRERVQDGQTVRS